MQLLFESSDESPGVRGLGAIPGSVDRFEFSSPAVPHIGWNEALPARGGTVLGNDGGRYYFVHSFRVRGAPAEWCAGVTDYGGSRFVSAVQRGAQCAVQFHPEKSGAVGLDLLQRFICQSTGPSPAVAPAALAPRQTRLAPRVIAALDVRLNDAGDLVVTKGDGYDVREKTDGAKGEVRNLGKPVDLCARYYNEGADEICILNICAFKGEPLADLPLLAVLRRASEKCFVPITIGGGIRAYTDDAGLRVSAVDVAAAYFRAGADKVSIGSDAVSAAMAFYAAGKQADGSSSISEIAQRYGRQAVVVSIDPRRVWVAAGAEPAGPAGKYAVVDHAVQRGPNGEARCWYECTVSGGRSGVELDAAQLSVAAEALGAGELMLNCIDCDGKQDGYDLELLAVIKAAVSIPVIASSGAGRPSHFVDVIQAGADAALAAGIFHRKQVDIADVKAALEAAGIPTRAQ
ncbi:hypothetical protein M885DRAFT_507001 [Pelagophyceae sp. CCMP2097]|nr:hypothetical protein M885DRAFT_507001 [Pelagophyceae sp. CCMP2097]